MLTCGDASGLPRVCTQAGVPGLEDEREQQQQPRLHRAPPHLRPVDGPRGLRRPCRPAAAHLSREWRPLIRPGPTNAGGGGWADWAQGTHARQLERRGEGRESGGLEGAERRAPAAPRATYRLPEGEVTGRAAPRLLAAG